MGQLIQKYILVYKVKGQSRGIKTMSSVAMHAGCLGQIRKLKLKVSSHIFISLS